MKPEVPASYEYRVIQLPRNFPVLEGTPAGQQIAGYLETGLNRRAEEGWEFVRIDDISEEIPPGCLGALSGQGLRTITHQVIIFRRARG